MKIQMEDAERPCAIALLIILLGLVASMVFGQAPGAGQIKPSITVVFYPIWSNHPDTITALVNVRDTLITQK